MGEGLTGCAMTEVEGTVRTATVADVPEATAVLTRAFLDKSPFDWMEPDPVRRARVMPVMFNTALRWMYPSERGLEVFASGDRVLGIAAWAEPGRWKAPLWVSLRALPGMIRALGGLYHLAAYGKRGQAVEAALHGAHPAAPHWYLAILGADPDAQGKGVGTALMRSGLARVDREGLPAYLECLEPLVTYYSRFGFQPTGRIAMPEGALDQIPMWRPPVTTPTAAARSS